MSKFDDWEYLEKEYGPRIKMDRYGNVQRHVDRKAMKMKAGKKARRDPILEKVMENYKNGTITAEDMVAFALAEMADGGS